MKQFTKKQAGFTLVEIMIVVAIIALLAAIAIPNVLRGRASANESAAVGNLRALVASLEMFRSVNTNYPDDWTAEMYGDDCAAGTPPDPDFGPPAFCDDMDALEVQGYAYTYTPADAPAQTYDINANPVTLGSTGTRSFWADESGQVFHCTGDDDSDALPDGTLTIDQAPDDCG
jgi:prepilin-type N-terminal cleavage/methylation domain-containing protein